MKQCADILTCPVCGERLHEVDRTLRCSRQHAFDRAREGYYNLLPAGHGKSKIQGDTLEMLQARRRFLQRGHYQPLSNAIADIALRHLSVRGSGRARSVLDAGCGTGYYVGRLAQAAKLPAAGDLRFIGLDVSRDALRLAARSYKDVCFLVNDVNHRICVADHSVDLLLNVFAPRNPTEFERVLRPDGLLLVVVPTDQHLRELRALLPLRIDEDKPERTAERLRAGFELVAQKAVEYQADMTTEDVLDLLRMTPNYWHLEEGTLAKAGAIHPAPMTVSVQLLSFRSNNSQPR